VHHEWEEATATWAADFVYRRDNIEHNHPGGIARPEINLHFWGYATWVFPYYLTKKYRDPRIVRRIEEAGEAYPNDAHVDQAIPGGFEERFPEFALYAGNQAPLPRADRIKRSFRQWDDLRETPHPGKRAVKPRRLSLGGARRRIERWPVRLRPGSRLPPLQGGRRQAAGDPVQEPAPGRDSRGDRFRAPGTQGLARADVDRPRCRILPRPRE
jgi:hypothetical protein